MLRSDWLITCVVVAVMAAAHDAAWAATADIRLPSDSTGGGTLAVRVYYPDSLSQFRYGSQGGAPVVAIVPGGFTAGSLALGDSQNFLNQGFIAMTFLFPGGVDGAFSSDGVYDDRGDASQRALRDVMRFATGQAAESLGRTLSQVVGGTARGDVAGALVLSNGGSIIITTLGRYGNQVDPLAFLVSWESPTNDQMLAEEAGTNGNDPNANVDADGDGIANNDVVNGAYIAYGFPQLAMDYARMRYDPSASFPLGNPPVVSQGLFFFDNNGDGVFNAVTSGSTNTDNNGNGCIDATEDFALKGLAVKIPPVSQARGMMSVASATRATSAGLVSPWPAHYFTASDCAAYWSIRDTTAFFPQAMANQPSLPGISCFSRKDHVQSSKDHAHVHHYLDGFRTASHWFRLNPDRAYVEAVMGSAQPSAADNDANLDPTAAQMDSLAQPLTGPPAALARVAALAELADRTLYGVWSNNLDAVVTQPPVTTSTLGKRVMSFVVNCHDWVNPALSADAIQFVMDRLEAHNLKGEFYVTAPVLEAWVTSAPALADRLRSGKHTVSYHIRPPHPLTFSATNGKLADRPLADWERYHLDLRTGDVETSRSGGYAYTSETLGRLPVATGINALTDALTHEFAAALAARGARLAVFDHGPVAGVSGYDNLLKPQDGLYPRPNDYFMARVDASGHPSDSGNFWWNRVADESLTTAQLVASLKADFLDKATAPSSPTLFGVCVIHEDNSYASGTPWGPVYFNDAAMTSPKSPPYDLTATAPWVGYRSEHEKQLIRDAFAVMVAAVAADADTRVLTSDEITSFADTQFSPASDPFQQNQWAKEPGFEHTPPAGYEWQQGSSTSGNFGGTFTIDTTGSQTGLMGMTVTANPSATYRVQQRVDLDKGKTYTFGASLKGSGLGSVTVTLLPVSWVGGALTPSAAPLSTRPKTGTFDWTVVTTSVLITSNHDYVLLQINITGGGTALVDNVFVRSTDRATLAVPRGVPKAVLGAVLIHSEDVAALESDTPYFRAKTQVLEDVASLLHRHGARLCVQPELELATGVQNVRPDFFQQLHNVLGCEFSVHTHGPAGTPTIEQVLNYISERKAAFEALGSGPVADLNGNFDQLDWSVFSQAGIRSMTAFKNTKTQSSYAGRYFHPWRPSLGNPMTNEAAWAVDNPDSNIVYLPGGCTQVTKYRAYLRDNILPPLTASLWNSEQARPTTWYFIMHVDSFAPHDGSSLEAYMASSEYQADLRAYEDLFTDLFDPLVERGFLQWTTPSGMRAAFDLWAGLSGAQVGAWVCY